MLQNGLVDLHTHIIYGVDDGARTFEDAQAMLLRAAQNGVTDIICTSHAEPSRVQFPADRYLRHLEKEQQWCNEQGLNLTLHIGAEIFYSKTAIQTVQEGFLPTLDSTWNVLVEFSPDSTYDQLLDCAQRFGSVGYSVIMAHIERYSCLHNISLIEQLKDDYGVRFQVNAGTCFERKKLFGNRWLSRVLDEGLIDFIASDAHNVTSRPCNLSAARDHLLQFYSEDMIDPMFGSNQRNVLKLGI